MATAREVGITFLKETDRLQTKAMERRMGHQRATHASFAMGLIGFLSAQSVVN